MNENRIAFTPDSALAYDRAAEAETNVHKLQTIIQAISDVTHAWQLTDSMTERDCMSVLSSHDALIDYVAIACDYCALLEQYFKEVQNETVATD